MSEEQRITKVEKEKDPRRVEAIKRLAAISRAAKERKAKQRSEAEQTTSEEFEPAEDIHSEGYSIITVLTGVRVLTGLVCLYFTYRQNQRAQAQAQITIGSDRQSRETPKQQPEPSSGGSKLRSLDD